MPPEAVHRRLQGTLAGAELGLIALLPVLPLPVPVAIPALLVAALSLWLRSRGFGDVGLKSPLAAERVVVIGLVLGGAAAGLFTALTGRPPAIPWLYDGPPVAGNAMIVLQALVVTWAQALVLEMVFRGFVSDRVAVILGQGAPGEPRGTDSLGCVVASAALYGWFVSIPHAAVGPRLFALWLGAAVLGAGLHALKQAAGGSLVLPIACHGGFASVGLVATYL